MSLNNRNNQKSRRANSSSSSSSAPPAQEFVSSLPQRSRRAALNHSNQNPQQAPQYNIRQEGPQLIGDDLENFPALSRDELEAQRRSYRALSTATPQRNASEVRALRLQLETAERASGLVVHQQHIHGPCPPEFLSSRYLPQAVAEELELRWMESEHLLDARNEQKATEDPDIQPFVSSTSGVSATPSTTAANQTTMTVTSHSTDAISTPPTDAPTGIVDAPQGTDTTDTPRFSSADPALQGSGPLAVEAGQESQQLPQQVSARHLGSNTNPGVDSTNPLLSEHPRPQGLQTSHITSSLVRLGVTQPPPSQKRMLPTLIGGVSVYNDGHLHVPLNDLHGSHMPVRDYPMTPLAVNLTPTHTSRIADTTQPPLTCPIAIPSLSSELLLGFVNELSGPLTAVRGYPMTPVLMNLDILNRQERTHSGVPLIPKGNGTNTALIETRPHKHHGTGMIPYRDTHTPRTDPADTHGSGENPNGDRTRPKDKHTAHTPATNNPKGTTSSTQSGTSRREHADPQGNIGETPLSNENSLDILAPRHGDKPPLIRHILPTHPLSQALTIAPATSAPTPVRQQSSIGAIPPANATQGRPAMIYVPPLMPPQAWRFPIGDSHTTTTHYLDGVLLSPIAPRGSTTIASSTPTLVPQARAGRLSPAISTRSAMPSLVEDESSYSPDYLSADQDYDNSQQADALSDSVAARARRSQPNPATRLLTCVLEET